MKLFSPGSKNNIYGVVLLCITVMCVAFAAKYIMKDAGSIKLNKLYKSVEGQQGKQSTEPAATLSLNDYDLNEIYESAHHMANGLILADAIWKVDAMNRENVNKLYYIVNNTDFPGKKDILDIIGRWKKGDFSKIVEDHNYFWDLLGGNVGRAYGINEKAVEEAVQDIKGISSK